MFTFTTMAQHRQGFTILEVVIALALLAVITGLLLSGFQQYAAYQQRIQAIQTVRVTLQESQTAARLSVGGTSHGVKIDASSIIQFEGSAYTDGDPSNTVVDVSAITMVPNLTGGVDEIVFTALSGYPSVSGTIIVTGSKYSGSSVIEVTSGGVVQ